MSAFECKQTQKNVKQEQGGAVADENSPKNFLFFLGNTIIQDG
jgi:hypothetical protein